MRLPGTFSRRLSPRPLGRTPRLFLERLEERITPVTPLNGFDGIFAGQAGNNEPPDSDGAVGPSSFIAHVNAAIAIYDKTTRQPISGGAVTVSNTFFAPIAMTGQQFTDPVTVYNDVTGRFGVGMLDFGHNSLAFAISTTSTPTLAPASWRFFRYTLNDSAGGRLGDYPKIGYNADGFVLSFNEFSGISGSFLHSSLLAIRNDGTSPGIQVVAGGTTHFTLAPTSLHGSAPGGPMWFTEAPSNSAGSTISVIRMNNVFTASPTLTFTTVSVTTYQSTVSPHQPGGQFVGNSNLGTRIYFSDERVVGGVAHLVAAHTVGDGSGFSRVQWYDINVTGNPILIQQGRINPGAGVDALFPCAAINAGGAIGIQYMQMGTGQFISMQITGRAASDPAGTLQTSVLARTNNANLTPNDRVGDYSFTSVDPNDGTFWGINEYAGSTGFGNWRTWVEHFSVPGGGGGTLTFNLSAANNNILVRNDPANPGNVQIVNATTSAVLQSAALSSLGNIAINCDNGTDTLTVSYQFGNPLPSSGLNYQSGSGTDTLNVNDTTTTSAQAFTVNRTSVQRAGSAPITFNNGGINFVNVNGGSGNNTYTVADTEPNFTTTLNIGSGTDTVNVQATTGPLTVNGQGGGGNDGLNLGNAAGTLAGIIGPVTVANSSSTFRVTVNDSGDTASHPAVNLSVTGLSGLAPAGINFSTSPICVNTLTITVGNGTNTYNISGSQATLGTTLNPGNGADTVNIPAIGNPLTVNNQGSNNQTDNLGSGGSLAGITAPVTLNNGPSFTVVNVNDGADNANHSAVALSGSALTGLASAAINFGPFSLRALNITVGNGTNIFTVSGTQATPAPGTTLTTGTGTNTVTVTGSNGLLVLAGNAAGSNTLIGPNVATTWNITGANAGNFSGGGAAGSFTGYQNLTGGSGTNSYVFANGASLSDTLNGGSGANNTLNLSASSANLTVNVTSPNSGNVVGVGAFASIANITGGSGTNSYVFGSGGRLSGALNAGSGSNNTLDLSAYRFHCDKNGQQLH